MTEREITLTHTTGFWWWKRTRQRTYLGSGTIWHDVETGELAGTEATIRLHALDWLERKGERSA